MSTASENQSVTHLHAVLAGFHQSLDEVILGLSQQLQYSLTAFGQGDCALPQVAQNTAKMFPTAVYEDPAWRKTTLAH